MEQGPVGPTRSADHDPVVAGRDAGAPVQLLDEGFVFQSTRGSEPPAATWRTGPSFSAL